MVAIAARRTKTVTKREDGRLLVSVTVSVVHHYGCRRIWQDDTEVATWIRSRRDKCATWTWTSSCHGIAVIVNRSGTSLCNANKAQTVDPRLTGVELVCAMLTKHKLLIPV